jgi:cyanate permease
LSQRINRRDWIKTTGLAAGAWALTSVATPANCTASLGAMQNFGGYLGGTLAPSVTGLIVQRMGSFALSLTVAAVIGAISAFAYFAIVRDPITSSDMDALVPGSQAR